MSTERGRRQSPGLDRQPSCKQPRLLFLDASVLWELQGCVSPTRQLSAPRYQCGTSPIPCFVCLFGDSSTLACFRNAALVLLRLCALSG